MSGANCCKVPDECPVSGAPDKCPVSGAPDECAVSEALDECLMFGAARVFGARGLGAGHTPSF